MTKQVPCPKCGEPMFANSACCRQCFKDAGNKKPQPLQHQDGTRRRIKEALLLQSGGL